MAKDDIVSRPPDSQFERVSGILAADTEILDPARQNVNGFGVKKEEGMIYISGLSVMVALVALVGCDGGVLSSWTEARFKEAAKPRTTI